MAQDIIIAATARKTAVEHVARMEVTRNLVEWKDKHNRKRMGRKISETLERVKINV